MALKSRRWSDFKRARRKAALLKSIGNIEWGIIIKNALKKESNVQPVTAPVTVCGDIHG